MGATQQSATGSVEIPTNSSGQRALTGATQQSATGSDEPPTKAFTSNQSSKAGLSVPSRLREARERGAQRTG